MIIETICGRDMQLSNLVYIKHVCRPQKFQGAHHMMVGTLSSARRSSDCICGDLPLSSDLQAGKRAEAVLWEELLEAQRVVGYEHVTRSQEN